ncbi:hypothetical protein BH09PSE5_BH09PSE5_20600 [soil metagenome]
MSTISTGDHRSASRTSKLSSVAVWLVLLGLIVFAITAYAGFSGMRDVVHNNQEGHLARENLALVERTATTLGEIESAQRGFMLTGNEEFLEPYFAGRSTLRRELPRIESRLRHAPAGKDSTQPDPLSSMIEHRLTQLETLVTLRRQAKSSDATINDVARYLRGKQLMDEIRNELGRLRSVEMVAIAAREENISHVQASTSLLIGLLAVGGTALMVAALALVIHERRRSEAAETAHRRLSESLATAVRHRTAELQAAHDRIRSFAHELDHKTEAERRRLAREVHDQFGQIAAGLKMSVSGLALDHPQLKGPAMDELKGLLDEAVGMARHIAAELRPPLLDDLGFEAAVDHYAKNVSHETGLRILVDVFDDEELSPGQANQLFRILQEAVSRALQHADASEVIVMGEIAEGSYRLTISDNGNGSGAAEAASPGIRNMHERADMAGGTLEFEVSEPRGTRVVARVPLTVETAA